MTDKWWLLNEEDREEIQFRLSMLSDMFKGEDPRSRAGMVRIAVEDVLHRFSSGLHTTDAAPSDFATQAEPIHLLPLVGGGWMARGGGCVAHGESREEAERKLREARS